MTSHGRQSVYRSSQAFKSTADPPSSSKSAGVFLLRSTLLGLDVSLWLMAKDYVQLSKFLISMYSDDKLALYLACLKGSFLDCLKSSAKGIMQQDSKYRS